MTLVLSSEIFPIHLILIVRVPCTATSVSDFLLRQQPVRDISSTSQCTMIVEDDTFVIHGPQPLHAIPDETIGKIAYDRLVVRSSNEIALVSYFCDYTNANFV